MADAKADEGGFQTAPKTVSLVADPSITKDYDKAVIPFPLLDDAVHQVRDLTQGLLFDLETAQDAENEHVDEYTGQPPFKRWLSTLRRRRARPTPALRPTTYKAAQFSSARPVSAKAHGHHKTLSFTSSVGLVTAVKSSTMTLAGTSITPGSSREPRRTHLHSDATGSSLCDPHISMDSRSGCTTEPIIDSKAWYRSIQRSNIVAEILSSEESYISDMKAMNHMYFTLLASAPALSPRRRDSLRKPISQIIELHEELLIELQKVVPATKHLADVSPPRGRLNRTRHTRWHSIDVIPLHPSARGRRRFLHSVDLERPSSLTTHSMMLTTNTVLNVAKIFDRFMRRFLTYEAYVAHHEIMQQEALTTSRMVPAWNAYERGVEALNASTTTVEQRETYSRKGLTLSDLGIKPIQRICKYPLFFADLCKHTPACDDPVANAELEKVLSRLHETAEEINDAMDNPRTRQLIETTWILQDRLSFGQELSHMIATIIRHLGHVVLCGALYIAYESSSESAIGHYMICILYRSWLILATVGPTSSTYFVKAVIPLLNATIERADNGRGLQCHTAPYTWKLVFQHEHKYHEVVMSACSETEEEIWKRQFRLRIAIESRDFAEGRHHTAGIASYLQVDVKPVGPAFEAQDGFTHRVSIRRAATLGPKTNLRQVIIKNTYAQQPGQNGSDEAASVVRSKSHMSASTMATLAPRRAERIRLEGLMADVWSRDSLPYPGMTIRRTENTIRASANSVMRKLSMASIASNFSMRTASFNSTSNHRPEEPRAASQKGVYRSTTRTRRLEKPRPRICGPGMVDFHSAPSAFLPEDFELRKPTLTVRGQNFVKRAMTMEGPRAQPDLPTFLPCISPTQISPASLVQAYEPTQGAPGNNTNVGPTPNNQAQMPENTVQLATAICRPTMTAKGLFYRLIGVNKDD